VTALYGKGLYLLFKLTLYVGEGRVTRLYLYLQIPTFQGRGLFTGKVDFVHTFSANNLTGLAVDTLLY